MLVSPDKTYEALFIPKTTQITSKKEKLPKDLPISYFLLLLLLNVYFLLFSSTAPKTFFGVFLSAHFQFPKFMPASISRPFLLLGAGVG